MTMTIGTVPRYTIDLNAPPQERWDQIIEDYTDQWLAVQRVIKNQLKEGLGDFLGSTADRGCFGLVL